MIMKTRSVSIKSFLFCFAFTVVSLACQAETVKMDLLLGIGDFAKCTCSKLPGVDPNGIIPTQDTTIANGWWAVASENLTASNYIFRLVKYQEISYQYFALKGIASGAASLDMRAQITPGKTSNPQAGDTVTFTIDRCHVSDYDSGNFQIVVTAGFVNIPSDPIKLSSTDTQISVTTTVPSGITDICPYVRIWTQGNLGNHQPGVYISGAHLYVRRSGTQAYDTETVPTSRNRTIGTNNVSWEPYRHGVRPTAGLYDEIYVGATSYQYFASLRKLNPDIKLYLYQSGTAAQDTSLIPLWAQTPFTLDYILANHSSWLVSANPDSPKGYQNPHGFLNQGGYADKFVIKAVGDPVYQSEWVSNVISKAKLLGVDGVWIDDCCTLTISNDGFTRSPAEVQAFLHGVIPQLKQAGLAVVVNGAEFNLDSNVAWNNNAPLTYFNPLWTPDNNHPTTDGYTANSPTNTPDVFFREFSFISNGSRYNSAYWLRCLDDADIISSWNSKLSASTYRRLHYAVCSDKQSTSTDGEDGWVQFGLASYLLCQNQYTSFGVNLGLASGFLFPDVDYSITSKLGDAYGSHKTYNGDQYFRYRIYKANSTGGLGGIVIVNANDASRSYTTTTDLLQSGRIIPTGTTITLPPHTGRILLNANLNPGASDTNLSVNVIVPTSSVKPGQTITITVSYTNNGTSDAKNVEIQAVVPAELKYVAGSAEASGGSFNQTTNTVRWIVSKVTAGQSGSKTFKATVS